MCISPNSIKVTTRLSNISRVVSVPCGHCYECVRKYKLDWEIRLTAESAASAHTFFGMLTYNDMFYHYDVDRNEIAYYIKRLRYNLDKYYPGATLKYFVVSELGELKDRLHYHVLYFVSSEFTDTHREFEELCKMSWVCKVPLSEHDIAFRRHCFKSWCKNVKPKRTDSVYLDYRNWSRRRYDDCSLGFATCQMLKGGTAIGSIHYACKYIQKQYNKKFSSHLGYRVWLDHMVKSGKFVYQWDCKEPYAFSAICVPKVLDCPTFPVRGKLYPVPKSWLLNSIGKYMTSYFRQKLARKYMDQEKIIDEDRIVRFWFDEPERLHNLEIKEKDRFENRKFLNSWLHSMPLNYDFDNESWLMSTTQKRSLNSLVEADMTWSTETLLPLEWDTKPPF